MTLERDIIFDLTSPASDVLEFVCDHYDKKLAPVGGASDCPGLIIWKDYIDANPGVPFGRALRRFLEVMRSKHAVAAWPLALFAALHRHIPDQARQLIVMQMGIVQADQFMNSFAFNEITPRERKIIKEMHWNHLGTRARRMFVDG